MDEIESMLVQQLEASLSKEAGGCGCGSELTAEELTGGEDDIAGLDDALAELASEDPLAMNLNESLEALEAEEEEGDGVTDRLGQLITVLRACPGLKVTFSF